MSAEIWMVLGFFACVMVLITIAGYVWMTRVNGTPGEVALAGPAPASTRTALAQLLEMVGQVAPTKPADLEAVRRKLLGAGYRSPASVAVFFGLQFGSALLLAITMGWLVVVVQESLSAALLPCIGALYIGYTMPARVLRAMTKARSGRIRRALPDALDLLVLCVEAGQSLDQALVDAGTELKRSHPDLAMELLVVHLELRAGKDRAEALRDLSDRNPEPELRKLATLLIQSDRFGASLGPALRVHAKYLRIRSKQQAEETARKISIKLLFPIFFLIFPAMMIVTAGPAILQIFTQLLPMIRGD
jgi:tight adherence protein C